MAGTLRQSESFYKHRLALMAGTLRQSESLYKHRRAHLNVDDAAAPETLLSDISESDSI